MFLALHSSLSVIRITIQDVPESASLAAESYLRLILFRLVLLLPLKRNLCPSPGQSVCDQHQILRIDEAGKITRSQFDDSNLFSSWHGLIWRNYPYGSRQKATPQLAIPESYLEEVKSVASAFGYTPETIDRLAAMGFSAEELEEFLYCGEL